MENFHMERDTFSLLIYFHSKEDEREMNYHINEEKFRGNCRFQREN